MKNTNALCQLMRPFHPVEALSQHVAVELHHRRGRDGERVPVPLPLR